MLWRPSWIQYTYDWINSKIELRTELWRGKTAGPSRLMSIYMLPLQVQTTIKLSPTPYSISPIKVIERARNANCIMLICGIRRRRANWYENEQMYTRPNRFCNSILHLSEDVATRARFDAGKKIIKWDSALQYTVGQVSKTQPFRKRLFVCQRLYPLETINTSKTFATLFSTVTRNWLRGWWIRKNQVKTKGTQSNMPSDIWDKYRHR